MKKPHCRFQLAMRLPIMNKQTDYFSIAWKVRDRVTVADASIE